MSRSEPSVYELHGLAVQSERPLDGPLSSRPPDWVVHQGDPIEVNGPPAGELIGEIALGDFNYWSAAQGERRQRWIVHHRGAQQTELDLERRTITVHPDPRAGEGQSHVLLAGSGMAHALTAEGHSPLHASAVEVDGRAIAFIGPSGKGKTTLAGLLCARGAHAVSDDVLRCEIVDGEAVCYRGGSNLRLRAGAAGLAEGLKAAAQTAEGRTVAVAEPTPLARMPLAALVVPGPSRSATELAVWRLRGRAAAAELLRSPRIIGWIDPELAARHLELSQALAARVPVLATTIPWGPPFADGIAEELIDRVLSAA